MENILVILIVGLAAFFIGRSYYKKYKKSDQCSCGCSSCPADTAACDLPEADKKLTEVRPSNN
jgi:hypothetical protein